MLKSVFIIGLTRFFCLAFKDNYVKTYEGTPILSATIMFAGTLVSRSIRSIRICAAVFARVGVN